MNYRFLANVCLVIALLLYFQLWPASASSSLTDSRINQLEFQVRSLQTQLNQLQAQPPSPSTRSANIRPNTTLPETELSLDEQFDNLATLVIEINQRVIAIENRLH